MGEIEGWEVWVGWFKTRLVEQEDMSLYVFVLPLTGVSVASAIVSFVKPCCL